MVNTIVLLVSFEYACYISYWGAVTMARAWDRVGQPLKNVTEEKVQRGRGSYVLYTKIRINWRRTISSTRNVVTETVQPPWKAGLKAPESVFWTDWLSCYY
jgi:hypothetical protein